MAADFSFVHAADLHLGAPFRGVDAEDPRVSAALVDSTYRALDRLVELCIEREAAFLVIAGDVTDQESPRLRAEMRFQQAMQKLADASVPVFVAKGNHDAADRALDRVSLPENVHVFSSSETERVAVGDTDGKPLCVVYGRSYARFDESGNLAGSFSRLKGDGFAVGVLHANVGGVAGFEPYAPCSLGDLIDAGMDYWALGHIHKPGTVCDEPLSIYPGSPQGLNPKEIGPHGVAVVTVAAGVPKVERVTLASIQWSQADVDVTGAADIDAVLLALRDAMDTARSEAEGRDSVARFTLTGRCAAHALLGSAEDLADLVERVRADGMCATPWIWTDRILDSTAGEVDLAALESSQTFLGDVVRLARKVSEDPAAAEALVGEVAAGVRSKVGRDTEVAVDAPAVVAQARGLLVDRLLAGQEE